MKNGKLKMENEKYFSLTIYHFPFIRAARETEDCYASFMHFIARVISGAGRGKHLGVPTLNLELQDVPEELIDGVYACWAVITDEPANQLTRQPANHRYPASMHLGPRPTFNDSKSCEVHLIDAVLPQPPEKVTVEVLERLRGISKFPSPEALTAQMHQDIAKARAILST